MSFSEGDRVRLVDPTSEFSRGELATVIRQRDGINAVDDDILVVRFDNGLLRRELYVRRFELVNQPFAVGDLAELIDPYAQYGAGTRVRVIEVIPGAVPHAPILLSVRFGNQPPESLFARRFRKVRQGFADEIGLTQEQQDKILEKMDALAGPNGWCDQVEQAKQAFGLRLAPKKKYKLMVETLLDVEPKNDDEVRITIQAKLLSDQASWSVTEATA